MRAAAVLTWLLAMALLAGCHTFHFEISDGPVDRVVYERKAFFFWGLAPTAIYCRERP